MKFIRTCVAIAVLAIIPFIVIGCGGGGSSSNGLTINGAVYDISTSPASPAAGVTVTLRNANNIAITTTTSANDGTFTITNVPASTDMYLNVSKATYASFNDEIVNIATSISGKLLLIALASDVKNAVDLFTNRAGNPSPWSDPFYAGQCWFAMDIFDATGNEVSGITVTANPSSPTIVYNNGFDAFTTQGPTVTPTQHGSANLVGGYNPTSGVYSFTLADASKNKTVKLPLVQGEMTYLQIQPW